MKIRLIPPLLSPILLPVLVLLFVLLSGISSAAHAQTKPVPLFLQENLDIHGRQLSIDKDLEKILIYFERESGLRLDWRMLPWNRAQMMGRNGEGIVFGLSKSPERLKYFQFSQPVVSEKIWAITYGEPRQNFRTLEDLRGKTVSIGRGFSHGMDFEKARNVVFTVQEDTASSGARFKKLMNKRSDLMLWPVRQLNTAAQVEDYLNNKLIPGFNEPELKGKRFYVSRKPVFYDTVHFAVAHGQYQEELARLNEVIRRGTESGELPKLMAKFY
ncbi:substrate-binding periplasmic protein [Undibacterium crateris]|uniref:substrate-binding periplasmic protein n=1 Tax=Undibacterium crateris TaxID=2528175 RepID=UPI001389435A|nr:transporter substrate-binding domain-containing protein [Undibacterium crateris]NDI84792.1 transporter substrate-binding domain-containing protein [Undibacterium crateris]